MCFINILIAERDLTGLYPFISESKRALRRKITKIIRREY